MTKQKFRLSKYTELDASPVRHRILRSWVEDYSKDGKVCSLLDWGCGPGTSIQTFRERHPDWDFHMADIADKRSLEQDKPFYLLDADNPSLPLPPNSMDVIVCSEVLEHVHNLTATIREIHRLLNPGGILVGSIPNFRHVASRVSYLRGNLYRIGGRFEKGSHINFITPPFLQNFLSEKFNYVYHGGDVDWLSWVDLVPARYSAGAYKRLDFKGLRRENCVYNPLSYDYLFGFQKKPPLQP